MSLVTHKSFVAVVLAASLVFPAAGYALSRQEHHDAVCAAVSKDAVATNRVIDYFQLAVEKADANNPAKLAADEEFFRGIPRPQGC